MRRDMDLIRELLLNFEERADGNHFIPEPSHTDFDQQAVSYHVGLLYERGLIKATPLHGHPRWSIQGLTWEGHEFLDDARNDTVWAKAKERAGGTFKTVSFEMVKALLQAAAREVLRALTVRSYDHKVSALRKGARVSTRRTCAAPPRLALTRCDSLGVQPSRYGSVAVSFCLSSLTYPTTRPVCRLAAPVPDWLEPL